MTPDKLQQIEDLVRQITTTQMQLQAWVGLTFKDAPSANNPMEFMSIPMAGLSLEVWEYIRKTAVYQLNTTLTNLQNQFAQA